MTVNIRRVIHLFYCKCRPGAGGSSAGSGECVRVVLRCRPLSQQENADKRKNIVSTDGAHKNVVLQPARPGDPLREFSFDAVFGQDASPAQVSWEHLTESGRALYIAYTAYLPACDDPSLSTALS